MSDLLSCFLLPPYLQSPVPELTQRGRAGEGGGVPADPGGSGALEAPGGAKGSLVERQRAESVLERLPQRADGEFLLVPATE